MNGARFTKEFVRSLQEVVPSGFHVVESGGDIEISRDNDLGRSGVHAREIVRSVGNVPLFVQGLETALSDIQDYIAERTGEPWPGKHMLPLGHAQVTDDTIFLWYGDGDDPVLRLEPLHLDTEEK